MLLDLEDAVFAPADHGPLIELLRMVAQDRHDWRPTMTQAMRAQQFVQKLADAELKIPALTEWAKAAVELSAYPGPSGGDAVVISPENLDELVEDLGRPAVLIVENKRADGQFLATVAVVLDDTRIAVAVSRGWLQIQHGGGNSMMAWLVEQECRAFHRLDRVMALLDGDQKHAGARTKSLDEADEIRRAARGRVHVWGMRSIENYVPFRALEHHCARDTARLARVTELRSTAPDQRRYTKVRDKVGKFEPLIPRQVTLTEDDFAELGNDAVGELRHVLTMVNKIL